MSITEYLASHGCKIYEGYSQEVPEQVIDLINLTKDSKINMMEIGFHAGHSAEIFLKNNENLLLTSFDLGMWDFIPIAKKFIDVTYPNRHTLILGNSLKTVPQYISNNSDIKFDIIFIDGGHDYNTAYNDLNNCLKLAHKDTIIIVDDTMYKSGWEAEWTIGPTKVWNNAITNNIIYELNHNDYRYGRGMSWGRKCID
jgi:predicted O-methyltransferase YrrM